jgi:hypothetical protein
MSKFFKASEEIKDFVFNVLEEETPYLASIGLDIEVVSTTKQPTIVKVTKSSPLLEYLVEKEGIIFVVIYEDAFERLTEEYQKLIIANALDAIEFDREKDKVNINNNNGTSLSEGIYLKHREPSVLALFAGAHAVRQVDEEQKEAKKR